MKEEPSIRQLRVGEEIKRTISKAILQGDIHSLNLKSTLIISQVEMSHDLGYARVFFFSTQQNLQLYLNKKSRLFKKCLFKKLHLRKLPNLIFIFDTSFDKASYVENMILDKKF